MKDMNDINDMNNMNKSKWSYYSYGLILIGLTVGGFVCYYFKDEIGQFIITLPIISGFIAKLDLPFFNAFNLGLGEDIGENIEYDLNKIDKLIKEQADLVAKLEDNKLIN
jgi:hypothetical protein